MLSNKNKTAERNNYEEQYCYGFNLGSSLVKEIPIQHQEQTKKLLNLLIIAKPKDISLQATLTGFCYEIVRTQNNDRLQNRTNERLKEMENINEKIKNREREQGR